MIAITMGDPNGVGPEVILKAWTDHVIEGPALVVGDEEILRYCGKRIGVHAPLHRVSSTEDSEPGELNVLDLNLLHDRDLDIGHVSRLAGEAAVRYVEAAVRLALDGKVSAVCTLPINKEAVRLSDRAFSGHTELIARMCGVSRYAMMLASDRLVVTHVSTHVSVERAVQLVRKERILDVILLTHETMHRFTNRPRIAVAGLNPHAGEHGAFGREEEEHICPAIEAANAQGIDVAGPVPPDTVFYRAAKGEFDVVVCMYHDQGHIPMKLLDFDGGVNITLGLPIIRTSVDHGTAFDIAYKGIASTRSFIAAFRYAKRLLGSPSAGVRSE